MFQVTQKSKFYFSRVHCCEVTVKKMFENQYFPCFEAWINIHLSSWNSSAVMTFLGMLPVRNLSDLSPMYCYFWRKCISSHKLGQGRSTSLKKCKSKTISEDIISLKKCKSYSISEDILYMVIELPHFKYCEVVWGNCDI